MIRKHDLAYAAFLPPAILGIISGIASLVPMNTGTAGGIGLLLLVPLALAALVSVPFGLYSAMALRRDAALVALAVATVLMLIQLFAELGSVKFQNALWPIYGALVLALEALWFLFRRRRYYATST